MPTVLRLTPVMEVLKLVAVAFGCPWREQGEIVPPEAAEIPVCLGWPWEVPISVL